MPDQLVDYNPEITKEWKQSMMTKNKVNQQYTVCANCGTQDFGVGKTCSRCRFPLTTRQLGGNPA
jgi:ribosomal protein L37E